MLGTRLPANTLQGMMQLCCDALLDDALLDDGNTFYSQRVFDLFPQLATANSGWSTHTAQANSVFGSTVNSESTNNSDYIEWTKYLDAGNYKFLCEHETSTDRGRADLSVDGGAVVSQMDQYSASATRNVLFTSAEFTVTEGSHTFRLTKNGKHASSSAYTLSAQHAQLVKQDATSALSSVANVPHVIDVPVVFADSHTNWNTLTMSTASMFGTTLDSSGAQNSTVTLSFWAPKGAFTLAMLHAKSTDRGIYAVSVDGGSIGTIDGYNASLSRNVLDTSLTSTFATTGTHTITLLMSTKNGSSSSYVGSVNHIQIRMTSITEPLATDLAPEVALLWPVFAEGNTNFSTIAMDSNIAYYYRYSSSGAQNASFTASSNLVLKPGTYRLDILSLKLNTMGKYHALVDTVDQGNVDAYAAGGSYNNVLSITGIVLAGYTPHTTVLKMASKHASSTNYFGYITLARLIRTGD